MPCEWVMMDIIEGSLQRHILLYSLWELSRGYPGCTYDILQVPESRKRRGLSYALLFGHRACHLEQRKSTILRCLLLDSPLRSLLKIATDL